MSLWIVAPLALAVETETIRDSGYGMLVQGELQSMALSSDGYLLPTYARRRVGDSGAEIIWDVLREKSGSVLCATGHRGRLVRVVDEHTSKTLKTFPEPELTAMTRLRDGSVLVAAASTGRIYRLATDDRVTTYTRLKAGFVWRMVTDAAGDVWVVTGTEGRLFRLHPTTSGPQVEEIYKFKSANLLDLWIDEKGLIGVAGDIYVAGQNPGWLYRFRPSDKQVEVVYNATAEEIRALLPVEGGLALALNTERSPSSQVLSMTLRMSGGATSSPLPPAGGGAAGAGGPGGPGGAGGTPSGGMSLPDLGGSSLADVFSSAQQQYGVPRSEIVILNRAGFVRHLWTSPERPIHSLALAPGGHVLAAAGSAGRLFEVEPNGQHSVVVDLREDYLLRIVADARGYLLAAARNGVVYDMARSRTRQAVYVSRPLDGGTLVKWGKFYWHGDLAAHQQALVAFRTGNDGDPDSSFWSPWSKEQEGAVGRALSVPVGPARYVQYRMTLKQDDADTTSARMDAGQVYYREQNMPPRLTQITVGESSPSRPVSGGGEVPGGRGAAEGSSSPVPAAHGGGEGGTSTARDPRSNSMLLNISWKAIDPNSDTLRYKLYYKSSDETEWKLIDDHLSAAQLPLTVNGVADGRYRFKVIASDELSNPPGEGLQSEMVSDEVIINNTPPAFVKKSVEVQGKRARIRIEVASQLSLLAVVKADVDNGDSLPLAPVDGIMDDQRESFDWQTPELKPGEHVVTINATDQRGNTAVDKIVFTIR